MKRLMIVLVGLACVAGAVDTVSHEILFASPGSGSVVRMDRGGKIVWSAKSRAARDAWLLDNGNILYKDGSNILIVDPKGSEVWKYTGAPKTELHACQPLPNDHVMIAECGEPGRIIEVDSNGKIVKEVPVSAKSKVHMQMRGTRKTKAGTYITALSGDQDVVEIDDAGKVLRHYKPEGINYDHVHGITCLENGNVIVGTGKGGMFIEVDKNNRIVWQITAADLKGQAGFDDFQIAYAAGSQRLANGNTICAMHQGSVAMFEVTPDKKIVWTLPMSNEIKGAICVMVLDESERGEPSQK